MSRQPVQFDVHGGSLAGDRWGGGGGGHIVLLHAGVADRRSWYATAEHLAAAGTVIAYDRRGFGDSRPGSAPYRHVDDLITVLDQLGPEPAWLVGSSAGGQVALEAAVLHPDRVAGLVLIAPAVRGAPAPTERLDPATQRISDLLDAADGDLEETNRLEAWLWLDGPAAQEGRVGGPARVLALAMNATILANDVPEEAGATDVDVWQRLDEVTAPTVVSCGDLDVPFFLERCAQLAARLPNARGHTLPGTAHLPYLERPDLVGALIEQAVTGRSAAAPGPGHPG